MHTANKLYKLMFIQASSITINVISIRFCPPLISHDNAATESQLHLKYHSLSRTDIAMCLHI